MKFTRAVFISLLMTLSSFANASVLQLSCSPIIKETGAKQKLIFQLQETRLTKGVFLSSQAGARRPHNFLLTNVNQNEESATYSLQGWSVLVDKVNQTAEITDGDLLLYICQK